MKRHVSLLIIVALLSSLTACGESVPTTDNTTDSTVVTEAPEQLDKYGRKILPKSEKLGDGLDFGGKTITFAVRDTPEYAIDFLAEEANGEVVNDAIFDRNRSVEEELNVKIAVETIQNTNSTSSESVGDKIRQTVLAGDTSYDIAAVYQFYGMSLATDGMFYNLLDTKYIDFNQPWWNQDLVSELTYKNQLYVCIGDMNVSVTAMLTGMFFNQRLMTDYYGDYEQLYDLVYEGKWTFDKLCELVKGKYKDVNGDSVADENDIYGLSVREDNPGPWAAAFNIYLCQKDNKGVPQLSFYSERSVDAYAKLYSFYKKNADVYFGAKTFNAVVAFADGKSLFSACQLQDARNVLRDMTDNYGILPMPKYDEAQENYRNTAHDESNLVGIVTNSTNVDAASAVLELLNYYSYQMVTPAYFETAMKNKYLADSDSAKMLDIIRDGAMVDFGQLNSLSISGGKYSMEGTYHVLLRNLVRLNIEDISSHYAKYAESYEANLKKLVALYDDLSD